MRMLQHKCAVLKKSFRAFFLILTGLCISQTRLAGTRCIRKVNSILSSRDNRAIEEGKWYFKLTRNSMVQDLKHNTCTNFCDCSVNSKCLCIGVQNP